jgi:hypothetical protein
MATVIRANTSSFKRPADNLASTLAGDDDDDDDNNDDFDNDNYDDYDNNDNDNCNDCDDHDDNDNGVHPPCQGMMMMRVVFI